MPLWVEWGDAIWQLAFLFCIVVGAALAWSTPRRHAEREAKSWIVEPTPLDRFEEGAETIVEGTLRGGADSILVEGATIAAIQGSSSGAIDHVPMSLQVGNEVIELEGPMELLLGSEEVRPRAPFRRDGVRVRGVSPSRSALHAKVCALPDGPTAAGQLEGQRYVIRSLRSGDRVQARGVLRRTAAQDEAAYRETQGRWVLRGSEQRPLALGSARRPHMAQKDVDRLAIGALAGGLAFTGVFIGLAALLHNAMPTHAEQIGDYEGVALALTVTPLHRQDGLESLRRTWHSRADAASLEKLAELVAMQDGCHAPVALWQTHGQTQRAIRTAVGCDSPVARLAVARAHYARGDMATASQALQGVRDELDLRYSPTRDAARSRVEHGIGATRAHLARARWRTAARELDDAWATSVDCVADAARARGGVDPSESSYFAARGEPCLVLEASERPGDRSVLAMMPHSAIAHLLLRESDPTRQVFDFREPSHVEGESFELSEMELALPEDPTCPIDPRGAPGLERSVLSKLLALETRDQRTTQLIAILAARRALIEIVEGRPADAAEHMAIMQSVAGRVPEEQRLVDAFALWNPRADRPPLSDEMARAAWNDPRHDRDELLCYRASSASARDLVALGHDRPILGTFREHFCDAAARAMAAQRAGMEDVAREQRAIAHEFRTLLEGRRASVMLWVLDRRND